MSIRIILWCALMVLNLSCRPPQVSPNPSFAMGLFFRTTDHDWSAGITNITIAKTKSELGFREQKALLSKSSIVQTETNLSRIAALVN